MSVTVRQLNGDSTFLLIFTSKTNPTPYDLRSTNGAYSILIDPWIVGSSVTAASWFAITNRVEPSAIQHLSELDDEPDVVICSQNKQDHTNKDTLLQLRPEGKTMIVAEPAAAKVIKSWNHFDPYRIHAMNRYDPKVKFGNTLRLHIPPLSPYGEPGEINIAFIPAKNYMTGLHNAFGITYRPPTQTKGVATVSTIDLSNMSIFGTSANQLATSGNAVKPQLSPPLHSPTMFFSPQLDNDSEETVVYEDSGRPSSHMQRTRAPIGSRSTPSSLHSQTSDRDQRPSGAPLQLPAFDFDQQSAEPFVRVEALLTPPASPDFHDSVRKLSFSSAPLTQVASSSSSVKTSSDALGMSQQSMIHPGRPKVISVLYTPHGISLPDLTPYIQNHLVRLAGALPLTVMLHSFDHADNPWFFGGNIMTGATGGIQIARALMARCWISAHDEAKDDRGLAVKLLRLRKTATEEIQQSLRRSQGSKSQGWFCDVKSLGVGEQVSLSNNVRDLGSNSLAFGLGSPDASMLSSRPATSAAG